jgi:hypothetical protein
LCGDVGVFGKLYLFAERRRRVQHQLYDAPPCPGGRRQ